jgi:hypothetical protein
MHPTRFRWFIIFLLFAISIINYIDRAAIDILGAFGLGYAITTLLARRSWAASWSTAGLASCRLSLCWSFTIPIATDRSKCRDPSNACAVEGFMQPRDGGSGANTRGRSRSRSPALAERAPYSPCPRLNSSSASRCRTRI